MAGISETQLQTFSEEYMLDTAEIAALKDAAKNYTKSVNKTGVAPVRPSLDDLLRYMSPKNTKYADMIRYKVRVVFEYNKLAEQDPNVDAKAWAKDYLDSHPYSQADARLYESPAASAPATTQNKRQQSKDLAAIQRNRNLDRMAARTNRNNIAAQNQADAGQYESPATSTPATTPVSSDGKPFDGVSVPVADSVLGSRTTPLPNSVAAQAKAMAGQWIMTRNGLYQLKQADIDWAKKKVSAQKPAAQKPAAQKPAAQKPAAQKPAAQKPDGNGSGGWAYTMNDGKVMYQDPDNPAGLPKVADSREQYNDIVRAIAGRRF